MAKLSTKSEEKLATVHPDLQRVVRDAITHLDFTVLEGHRTPERQRRLFAAGKTKIDGTTKKGKHNYVPALAIDITPYPIDFADIDRHHDLAALVLRTAEKLGVEIRWGGDWDRDNDTKDQKFNDLVHFELVGRKYEQ